MVNEFTLEELQIIHLDMLTYINRTTILAESPSHRKLREKIEQMIENYCEHKTQTMCCDGGISIECDDCGAVILDV